MPKEAVFTLKLEPELRAQFVAETQAVHRPASQVMRELMRDYVARQKAEREHDQWFRAEVEAGLREADDPNTKFIPHEQVEAEWAVMRAKLLERIARQAE
jgi:predicted transcriptional regulator